MKTVTITNRKEIEEFIGSVQVCYISMATLNGQPYVLPMNFGYRDGYFYIHSGPHGKKVAILSENPHICVALHQGEELVSQDREVACSYSMKSMSMVFEADAIEIDDIEQKREGLDIMMSNYIDHPFTYSHPSLVNVKMWKIVPTQELTLKIFGLTVKEAKMIQG